MKIKSYYMEGNDMIAILENDEIIRLTNIWVTNISFGELEMESNDNVVISPTLKYSEPK